MQQKSTEYPENMSSSESSSEYGESEDEVTVPKVKITTKSDSESSKSDQKSDDESSQLDEKSDDEMLSKNVGWADSIQKILTTTKPKNKKTLVLSRAKKHTEVKQVKEVPTFDVVEGPEDIKLKIKEEPVSVKEEKDEKIHRRKRDRLSIRKKPNILEKDRERTLSKIATLGVVQLFNAVRNQQKSLKEQTEGSNITEGKKEKILQSFDKRAFLDKLMGGTKSTIVDKPKKEEPSWNALREDFMLDAKMKDWDKISE